MADILPFRALHYNPERVGDLDRVVTQPYDKITEEMQARYYQLSSHNLVRIIRGRQAPQDTPQDNVYSRAAGNLREWLANRILIGESEPALYPYYQEYSLPRKPGTRKQRRGFIALCRLEDYAAGIVHPHEETLAAPKADRLELLKATRVHFGQIFMLYSNPAGTIEALLDAKTADEPWQNVTDEYGSRHTVWRVSDRSIVERVRTAMRDKKLVIADGHHRYETALAYRNYCHVQRSPDERAEYVMATFVRKESQGLTILPTHRVVYGLPRFDWRAFLAEAQRLFHCQSLEPQQAVPGWESGFVQRLAEVGREGPALGAYAGPRRLALLSLPEGLDLAAVLPDLPPGLRRLDVVILHRLLLERVLGIDRDAVREERNLHYVREFEYAIRLVERGAGQVCFLMNPTPVDAVWDNALAGQPLPPKSTDFYPKLLSGLTAYWLDNPSGM